jgi:5-methylcytosine-specific restriction enzyme A
MVGDHGALGAVKRLLQPPVEQTSDGFTRLWELGRLDLAVECFAAFDERFQDLFTPEEREIAGERLALYGRK